MISRTHVPVRYLDRLNRLTDRFRGIRYAVEGMDMEAEMIMDDIGKQLNGLIMMINRDGDLRELYKQEAKGHFAKRHPYREAEA